MALDSEVEVDMLHVSSGMDLVDDWFLDSACYYHMCLHREWFDTYTACDGGRVLMGNNSECRTVGVGT